MVEGCELRRLTEADLPAYKALRDTLLASDPSAFTSDAEQDRARSSQSYLSRLGLDRVDGGVFVLGAWQGQTLLGSIACEREQRVKIWHIGHVIGMMVLPEARGQGLGRRLVQACIAQARATPGLEMLNLSVTAGNPGAVHLYLQAGFVRYGCLQRAIKVDGRYHDKDLMSLTL
jgi:RimJ/RimL family protein N-acetyltransferase